MQNKMFRTSLQQDSQEFLRCLLMQIHDETAVEVPAWAGVAQRSHDQSHDKSRDAPGSCRDSMVSSTSHDSEGFTASGDCGSQGTSEGRGGSAKSSPLPKKKGMSRLSLKQQKTAGSSQNLSQSSPTNHRRFILRGSSSKLHRGSGSKGSNESIGRGTPQQQNERGSQISLESQNSESEAATTRGEDGDVYEVDLLTRRITLHRNCHIFDCKRAGSWNEGREEREGELTRGCQSQSEGEPSTPGMSETETRSGNRRNSLPESHTALRQKKKPGQSFYSVQSHANLCPEC